MMSVVEKLYFLYMGRGEDTTSKWKMSNRIVPHMLQTKASMGSIV
jgi:hypothetical protein